MIKFYMKYDEEEYYLYCGFIESYWLLENNMKHNGNSPQNRLPERFD